MNEIMEKVKWVIWWGGTITIDVGDVTDAGCAIYDWNVGVSRFVDATFSWIVLIVFVSHGCQLLRLLCISAISVFIWCVKSWLRHWDSTSSSFVWAKLNSSSLICFVAFTIGSNGPRLSSVCLVNFWSAFSAADGMASFPQHTAQFDDFS